MPGRLVLLLAVACLLGSSLVPAASAPDEAFDVWRLRVPDGWVARRTPGLIAFAFGAGATSGQVGLYASRAADGPDLAKDVDREWKEVVEASFRAEGATALADLRLACGAVARRRTARTIARDGATSATTLLVTAPYGRIASLVVNAPTAEALRVHEKVVGAFLDTLTLDPAAVERASAPAGDVPSKDAVVGAWAASSGGGAELGGALRATHKRRYELRANGTYDFRSESFAGTMGGGGWLLHRESGTWRLDQGRLTFRPMLAAREARDRDGHVTKQSDPPREAVTYLARLVLFEGLGETQLVLTPPGETLRDGAFGGNDAFPASYLLSSRYQPEWSDFGR